MDESKKNLRRFTRMMDRMRKLNMSRKIPSIAKNEYEILGILYACGAGERTADGCPEENTPAVKVSRLAALMGVSPPSVSRTLRNMREKGFVCLRTDAADRRHTLVFLTEKGEAELKNCKKHMDRFALRVFERMGPEQVEQLLILLDRMIDIMEEELADAKEGDLL